MPVLRAPVRLERRRLQDALTSPASFVALVGPTGSGATTLLRAYAERVGNVQWVGDGALPERVTGVLVVDRAEALTAEGGSTCAPCAPRRRALSCGLPHTAHRRSRGGGTPSSSPAWRSRRRRPRST